MAHARYQLINAKTGTVVGTVPVQTGWLGRLGVSEGAWRFPESELQIVKLLWAFALVSRTSSHRASSSTCAPWLWCGPLLASSPSRFLGFLLACVLSWSVDRRNDSSDQRNIIEKLRTSKCGEGMHTSGSVAFRGYFDFRGGATYAGDHGLRFLTKPSFMSDRYVSRSRNVVFSLRFSAYRENSPSI